MEELRTKAIRINIATTLPSGVDQLNFSLFIHESGLTLEIAVKVPDPLVELSLLHTKWGRSKDMDRELEFAMYHSSILALKSALKAKWERASDGVFSTTWISRPFAIQTHIEGDGNLLFKKSGPKIVSIQLKAMMESNAVTADNIEFEKV